jgi:glyoxylase-like metal-dependent hydrolase (beta-lactamase superfamily II)
MSLKPVHQPLRLSRRTFLKGLGVGAASLGILPVTAGLARAQIGATDKTNIVYFPFKLGEWEMTVVSDAAGALPAATFGANKPKEEVEKFFSDLGLLKEGNLNNTILNLVLKNKDGVYLFDTGLGTGAGRLRETLEKLGIAADQVAGIFMSHWHPDHINGLSTDGKLTYPKAQVFFPQAEQDFLKAGPADVVKNAVGKLQPALDGDVVKFYKNEDELIPGVQAIATPGHTPGHSAFLMQSGGSKLLHVVDSAINAYASLAHPDWHMGFDADKNQAVETRTKLLTRASDESLPVFGYHFPFPGLGYAVRQGTANEWRWAPSAF